MLRPGTPGELLRLPHGDAALHWLLVALGLVMFVLAPLRELGWLPGWTDHVALVAVAIAGLLSLARPTILLWPLLLSALALAVLQGATLRSDPAPAWALAAGSAVILCLLLLAVALLGQVLAPGRVTPARIEGAIALYLLIALLFAAGYQAIETLFPGAFAPPQPPEAGAGRLRYFSLVAQTSTGFGDITPLHPLARALVTLQAVTGQIFVAVLLARLVSLELAARQRGTEGG